MIYKTVKYISSAGNEYTLNTDGIYRLKTANFHRWAWVPNGTNLQFGQRLANFSRAAAQYDCKLVFMRASARERAAYIDQLHTDFERDLRNMTPGRIDWGGWTLDCFIVDSSTYPDPNGIWTDNDIQIYAPNPFWTYEESRIFQIRQAPGTVSEFLDYDYDYDYDYTYDASGSSSWVRTFPFPSDFLLTIYGPVSNPRVIINGHPYQINTTVEEGARLEVSSRDYTVTLISGAGVRTNLFDLRDKTASVFQKIPGGTLTVGWSGEFMFELTLYQERSEPAWTV